ncbi:MAG: hypothetical protein JWM11_7199, partial [Planctomycetaceae bacterium]|nr:hypothetical protein [Planctomycetaceae bacterium]
FLCVVLDDVRHGNAGTGIWLPKFAGERSRIMNETRFRPIQKNRSTNSHTNIEGILSIRDRECQTPNENSQFRAPGHAARQDRPAESDSRSDTQKHLLEVCV